MTYRICANISMLFTELPLLDRFVAAREAGFQAVEILNPYAGSAESLAAASAAAQMPVVLINAALGDVRGGARGYAADPAEKTRFRSAMNQAFEYGRILGAERINLLPGRSLPGDDRSFCLALYADNLFWAADEAASAGLRIDVEALNEKDIPGSLFPTQIDAFTLLERMNHANIDLQFDYYHTLMAGQDPLTQLQRVISRVGHIQFADADKRRQPEATDHRFHGFLQGAVELGYAGYFAAEYRPDPDTAASLDWLRVQL